jgi:CheY-like chemotaxis protein
MEVIHQFGTAKSRPLPLVRVEVFRVARPNECSEAPTAHNLLFLCRNKEELRVSSQTILIVENNNDAADSLQSLLELAGYEVRVARDGLSGLNEARRWSPDLILSDLGLPALSGFELASALRQNAETARIRLVAVSAYSDPESTRKAVECGFERLIPKPANPAALLAFIGSA